MDLDFDATDSEESGDDDWSDDSSVDSSDYEYNDNNHDDFAMEDDIINDDLITNSKKLKKQFELEASSNNVKGVKFPTIIPTPSEASVLYSPFVYDKEAKKIFDDFAQKIQGRIDKFPGSVKNPHSPRSHHHYIPRPSDKEIRSVVYAAFNDADEFSKDGSTNQPKQRFDEKFYPSSYKIMELMNLENLPMELDIGLGEDWFAMQQAIINEPKASPQLRALAEIMIHRHGYRMGFKRSGVRLMVEGTLQLRDGGTGKAFEFLTHQQSVTDTCKQLAEQIKHKSLVLTTSLTSMILNSSRVGRHGSITTIQTMIQAMMGTDEPPDMSKIDTLPDPAYPNATTIEEKFSDDYDDETIQAGLTKAKTKINDETWTVLICDQNNKVFGGDGNIDKYVVAKGFIPHTCVFDGILRVYVNHKTKSILIVNKPWCLCLDSRAFITMFLRTLCCICAEAVILLGAAIRGQSPKGSALLANYLFQATIIGYHMHRLHATRVALDAVVGTDTLMTCRDNEHLPKTMDDRNYPVGTRNREIVKGKSWVDCASKFPDPSLYYRSMNICCNVDLDPSDDDMSKLLASIKSVLSIGTHVKKDLYCRFRRFMKKLKKVDVDLHRRLFQYVSSVATRGGNRNARGATNATKDVNNEICNDICSLATPG